MPIAQAEYKQRAIDRYHRRYLSAIKMLATVRRLALPILVARVTVAENQADRAARPVGLIAADQG